MIPLLVHILLAHDNVFAGKGEGALRYECPHCGNVSSEGLAIGAGPECVKCGSVMEFVKAHKPPPGRRTGRKRRSTTGRNLDAN
jgi:hypothetical protein